MSIEPPTIGVARTAGRDARLFQKLSLIISTELGYLRPLRRGSVDTEAVHVEACRVRESRPFLTPINCAQILRVALNEATVTLLNDRADRATVSG